MTKSLAILAASVALASVPLWAQATVAKATIANLATSIELPAQAGSAMYLYGATAVGALSFSAFTNGQYAQAVNASGYVAAELAYGTSNQNGLTFSAANQIIGGVAVSGPWDSFNAFSGSNTNPGAGSASVTFTVSENSLVVFIGLASSQQNIGLGGIAGFQIDALESGSVAVEGMVIGHAYLLPGNYTVTEQSAALAAGQNPRNMADLIGAFVFGSKSAMILSNLNPSSVAAGGPDFTLTLNGSGFVPGATVQWGNFPLSTSFVSSMQLTTFVPAAFISAPGRPALTVFEPDGSVSDAVIFNIPLAPGDQLIVTFTASPNAADLLVFFNNDILTSTGSPVFTTSLYDGQKLLGTYMSFFNGSSFVSVFGRPGGGLGEAQSGPSIVPFTSINGGTISGRLVTTISGGSVSGFDSQNIFLYDASSVAGGYRPLGDVSVSSVAWQVGSAPPSVPSITSISPSSADAGSPGFTLTVNGSGFSSSSTVMWNGAPLATSFVSATQLTAPVAAGLIDSPGSIAISVLDADLVGSIPAIFNVPWSAGERLVVTFTAAPNSADLLLFFNNDPLTITGSPVFTTNLYDGDTLLGTYTSAPFTFNGVSTFISAFASPGGGSGGALYSPTTVPFSSIEGGTIAGRLVTTISGGSVSGFNSGDLWLYDATSIGGGYRPLGDVRTHVVLFELEGLPHRSPTSR